MYVLERSRCSLVKKANCGIKGIGQLYVSKHVNAQKRVWWLGAGLRLSL